MTNPLHPFLLTLAVGWLSVGVVAVKYAVTVREAARRTAPGPETPPLDPTKDREAPKGESEKDKESPKKTDSGEDKGTDPKGGTAGEDQRPPSVPDFPEGVNWSAGEVLVLIVASGLDDGERAQFNTQIGHILKTHAGKLVGDDVFVVGRTRLRRSADWQKEGCIRDSFPFGEAGVVETFARVRADLEAVRRRRGEPSLRALVLWHSADCPEKPPEGIAEISGAQVVWSGQEFTSQRKCKALEKVFGKAGVTTHGAEIAGVAEDARNALARPLPPAAGP
jgi:hypothetical protein